MSMGRGLRDCWLPICHTEALGTVLGKPALPTPIV